MGLFLLGTLIGTICRHHEEQPTELPTELDVPICGSAAGPLLPCSDTRLPIIRAALAILQVVAEACRCSADAR